MKFSPTSPVRWDNLLFLPFRVFVFAAFVTEYGLETFWPAHVGGLPGRLVLFITFGYLVSLLVFLAGIVLGFVADKMEVLSLHVGFAILTIVFGIYSLRFLAVA